MVDRKLVAAGLVAALLLFAGCSGTSGANTEDAGAGEPTVDEETMTELEDTTEMGETTEEEQTLTEMGETTEETETLGNETTETEASA